MLLPISGPCQYRSLTCEYCGAGAPGSQEERMLQHLGCSTLSKNILTSVEYNKLARIFKRTQNEG